MQAPPRLWLGLPGSRRLWSGLVFATALAWLAPAAAAPPDEGECPTLSGLPSGQEGGEDATSITLKEGMVLGVEDLLILQQLLPREIWQHREAFFYEGMRMIIGSCQRNYALPDFYTEATARYAGRARVNSKGNLRAYRAGLPFPPEAMDPTHKDTPAQWAWNLEKRYRGAGHRGRFRLTDLPSAVGGVQVYEGDFFWIPTRHRADVSAEQDHVAPGSKRTLWIAGGRFTEPFNARHLAWRQFRPLKAAKNHDEADDVFVYVPTMRKARRAATTWVDGLYTPRYTVTGDSGGGGIGIGGNALAGGPAGAINPTAANSIQQTESLRRGFVGIEFRPNAFVWRVLGTRNVLAPLNGAALGWPYETERNFGPSGLSVASDRWDVRHAVLLEGALKVENQGFRTVTIYVDYQTQQPLYWITRGPRRRLLDVGVLVYRYSGDRARYPTWEDGSPALVFDPVAASFLDVAGGSGSGWRRESYDVVSIPSGEGEIERLSSVSALSRGH